MVIAAESDCLRQRIHCGQCRPLTVQHDCQVLWMLGRPPQTRERCIDPRSWVRFPLQTVPCFYLKDAYSKRKWTMTSTISSMAKEGPLYKWLQSCIASKHLVWKWSQLTPWAYYSGWHLPHWIGWLHFRLKAHTAALPSQPLFEASIHTY